MDIRRPPDCLLCYPDLISGTAILVSQSLSPLLSLSSVVWKDVSLAERRERNKLALWSIWWHFYSDWMHKVKIFLDIAGGSEGRPDQLRNLTNIGWTCQVFIKTGARVWERRSQGEREIYQDSGLELSFSSVWPPAPPALTCQPDILGECEAMNLLLNTNIKAKYILTGWRCLGSDKKQQQVVQLVDISLTQEYNFVFVLRNL